MKNELIGVIGLLILATALVIAGPGNGNSDSAIPENAVEVAPGLYSLGNSVNPNTDEVVQGFLFIDDRKKYHHRPDHSGGPPSGGNGGGEKCYQELAKGARWKNTEDYITTNDIDDIVFDESVNTWDSEVSFDIFGNNIDGVVDGDDSSSPDGKNEVLFKNLGDTNTIAYAIVWGIFSGPPSQRQLVEWDMVFNSNFTFGNAGETNELAPGNTSVMDFQNIATHELGHALGLDHPSDTCTEETMFAFADFGETKKRTLNSGDIAGVNSLY